MKNILLLLAIPHIAIFIVPLNTWQLMCFYVACMFLTFKLTSLIATKEVKWNSIFLYTTSWIGMNYVEFDEKPQEPPKWKTGLTSLLLGLLLFSFCVWNPENLNRPLLVFISMLFIFHFGILDLNAQLWKFFGRNTKPIMNEPWKAKTLADFWGKRWNLAFRDAAHKCIYIPFKNRFGAKAGFLAVFTFSGIVHEAVISVPAQGGYGGPMLYFLLQFLGLSLQKQSVFLNKLWFTWLILLAPLPLLFHQAFFQNVFIPLTKAIGG